MRAMKGLTIALSIAVTAPAVAAVPTEPAPAPTIFTVRLNGVAPPPTEYIGPNNPAAQYPASIDQAARAVPTVEEGGNVALATVSNLLGGLYDGALSHLWDALPVFSADPIKPAADPGSFRAAGLKADTRLPLLGLKSVLDVSVSTEGTRQSLGVSNGCGLKWLPNSVTGDVVRAFRAPTASGEVLGSWGTACASGQTGWRVIAGVQALGTPERSPSLGLEYRPAAGGLVAGLTGISAVNAQVAETGGKVGVEAPLPVIKVDWLKLNADVSWKEDGARALKLGTKFKF